MDEIIDDLGVIQDPETAVTTDGTVNKASGITTEDLNAGFDRLGDRIAEVMTPKQEVTQTYEEEYVDPSAFATVEALNAHLNQRDQRVIAQARAEFQAMMAPTQISMGTQAITSDMSDIEKTCFKDALNELPVDVRAAALSEPVMQKFLRDSAKLRAIEKTGVIHSTNNQGSTVSDGFNDKDRRSIQNLIGFGFTKEDAIKQVKQIKAGS